jgi:hypothetical protein
MDDVKKDVAETIASIKGVSVPVSVAAGTLSWCVEKHAKNALRRHKSIAGLLNVPDEHGIRDDTIREQLQNDAVEDGEYHEALEEAKTELEDAARGVYEAMKDFDALIRYWSAEHQRLTQEKHGAEVRISELTERLKEHALNSPEVREAVWAITAGKCFYCEIELVRGEGVGPADQKRLFHVDHLVPKILGGPDHIANYVPACHSCNSSKHARHFAEFVMSRKAKQEQPLLTVIEGGAA